MSSVDSYNSSTSVDDGLEKLEEEGERKEKTYYWCAPRRMFPTDERRGDVKAK
jgi:hypothetical protein